MKDQQGHNYFFAVSKTWKENKMAIRDQETDDLIKIVVPDILERLAKIESALSALQKQEEDEDAVHDETA